MKILENLLPGSQENEIELSKISLFDSNCDLIEYNLETLKKTTRMLPLPEYFYRIISTCLLPGNKLFCIGKCEDNSLLLRLQKGCSGCSLAGITFIVDENYHVKFLSESTQSTNIHSIYYDNCVYIFGGDITERFNLIKGKWEKLSKFPGSSNLSTCTSLSGMILASGWTYDDILVFDLLALSFSVCCMNLKCNSIKLLCSYENCAYLFDFSGKVFQSEINSPFNWNTIGNWNLNDVVITRGHRTFYKDCWYFLTYHLEIVKFDFKKKEIEVVNPLQHKGFLTNVVL